MALVDSFLPPITHRTPVDTHRVTHRTPVDTVHLEDAVYLEDSQAGPSSDRPSKSAAHVVPGAGSGAEKPRPAGSDELQWQVSYDRESVDRFISEIEVERARLENEIEAAKARVEHARAGAVNRQAQAQAELGALVIAAHRELEEIELQHREILEAIAVGAQQAIALLAGAREEAEAMLATAATLARHLPGPAQTDLPLNYRVDPTPFRPLSELPE